MKKAKHDVGRMELIEIRKDQTLMCDVLIIGIVINWLERS